METLMAIVQWIFANYQIVISSVIAICSAVIAISLLIPGEQPEKALQAIVDFLSKFSKK